MTPDDLARLKAQLRQHEGLRLTAYADTQGVLTIGYGHNLHRPIRQAIAELILDDDVDETVAEMRSRYPWFDHLDGVRQRAMMNMAFNVGVDGLHKSPKMLEALAAGDYHAAADEMLDGPWKAQVGARADTLASMVRTGHDSSTATPV